ncbi:GNAT family N-acetyltransferase [Taibaiella lutea]|uniref:GNAT family N-acetyltransferase n=2 Tax=Taibaiella lutea TaxID=2608001 RepID=A0A5M6CT21_9BACT|nr:GNAT family N-acetyltransferase [Taibaiella lutea]
MYNHYIFTSQRLGFRNWANNDVPLMTVINADIDVMEFFPATVTRVQTEQFIERMQDMFATKGYCYFAVDRLEDGAFIGFIGLGYQDYDAPFTPCTDIGWRLDKNFWNQGYATEGAERCLEYAFEDLKLQNIKAIAPEINTRSINIMQKIGMKKQSDFLHPKLADDERLKHCVCYEIGASR